MKKLITLIKILLKHCIESIKFQKILFSKRFRFLFGRKIVSHNTDYLSIIKDEHFANSAIMIEFHFAKLLYVKFPQVGRKYYNGKILLNAEKLKYPYLIKVKTFGKKKKIFTIESFEGSNYFHSEKFSIKNFKSFKNTFKPPPILEFSRHQVLYNNPILKAEVQLKPFRFRLKNQFNDYKTKQQPFNTKDFI